MVETEEYYNQRARVLRDHQEFLRWGQFSTPQEASQTEATQSRAASTKTSEFRETDAAYTAGNKAAASAKTAAKKPTDGNIQTAKEDAAAARTAADKPHVNSEVKAGTNHIADSSENVTDGLEANVSKDDMKARTTDLDHTSAKNKTAYKTSQETGGVQKPSTRACPSRPESFTGGNLKAKRIGA